MIVPSEQQLADQGGRDHQARHQDGPDLLMIVKPRGLGAKGCGNERGTQDEDRQDADQPLQSLRAFTSSCLRP